MADAMSVEINSSVNGDENSTRHEALLRQLFPTIDHDLLDYVKDVLEHGEDFETGEDIYEAVGGILHEVDGNESNEETIMDVCNKLLQIIKQGPSKDQKMVVRLDAPVKLENLKLSTDTGTEEMDSIWIRKQDSTTIVNQEKLKKAEAKIKQKQEKRADKENEKGDTQPIEMDGATASQTMDRREAKLESTGMNKSRDIRVENFDLAYGDRSLLKGANLMMAFGRRYGLVGRNGIGKTTLLRTLSKRELFVSSNISILHVEQEVVGDDTPALESVLECDTERDSLLKEERALVALTASGSPTCQSQSTSTRLTQIYARLEEIEADKAPARASVILAGLGFTPSMQRQCTREFSGGWRMRLALARALFSKPDLLLLDEPTNMLDLKAVMWLENYLQSWATTILVVSHDRNFLDSVTTDILHMHSQRLDYYRGNYENFHKTREEKLLNQQREYESQQMYRQHLQEFIDRFRYNAKRASLAQSKLKILEKLPVLQPVVHDPPAMLRFPECEKLSPPVLQLDEVTFQYTTERVIFKSVDISANSESRIAVVGDNGSGKTTLLKILLGELEPVTGIRHCHRNLKIGYFSQHHVDQLEMNQCAIEILASRFPGLQIEEYRHQLGRYGVSGELATRPLVSLSGGQKSRVVFSSMTMGRPNLLVLDEPTNHLDMETIEALAKALKQFKGGVILVSHDERLVRSVCNEVWLCGQGTVRSIEGGFDQYRKIVQDELKAL